MDKQLVNIKINNFRNIKRADIALNGITVVSGINGCGKSTISRLLYYILKNSIDYEDLAVDDIREKLKPYQEFAEQLQFYMVTHSKGEERQSYFRTNISLIDDFKNKDISHRSLNNLRIISTNFLKIINNQRNDSYLNRLKTIFYFINKKEFKTFDEALDIYFKQLLQIYNSYTQLNIERPSSLLIRKLDNLFANQIVEHVSINEYNDPIFGKSLKYVPIIHNFKNVIYLDTPMAIGIEANKGVPDYWVDLNNLLKKKINYSFSKSLLHSISNIIQGDVEYDELNENLKYLRNDGKIFELVDCATGIKSFSLLSILLKNGSLDNNTLFIIDEPETHLHPQWIVEYARLIVLLNKQLKIKFFLASHSADMVSAIRYFAENEGISHDVNFYQANSVNNTYMYAFENLKFDIEPIFNSFNQSFDIVNKYLNDEK